MAVHFSDLSRMEPDVEIKIFLLFFSFTHAAVQLLHPNHMLVNAGPQPYVRAAFRPLG